MTLYALLPELELMIAAVAILGLDRLLDQKQSRILAMPVVLVIALSGFQVLFQMRELLMAQTSVQGGGLVIDSFACFIKLLILGATAAVVGISYMSRPLSYVKMGTYYALLLMGTVAAMILVTANHLFTLILALEVAGLTACFLVGYIRESVYSGEGATKLLAFHSLSSALILLGGGFLYGMAGSFHLPAITVYLMSHSVDLPVMVAGFLLLAGLGSKVLALPLHFWAPDAYEGGSTPVAAFLATVWQIAGVALLIRTLDPMFSAGGQGEGAESWTVLIAIFAATTMTFGNLSAIWQRNLKRMVAYSCMGQAGFLLMGLLGLGAEDYSGWTALIYYLIVYTVTTLGVFSIVVVVANRWGTDDLDGYRGLSRRSPGLALALGIFILSYIGLPPTGGFIGKFQLVAVMTERGFYWLAIVAGINILLVAYFWARVMRVVFFEEPEEESELSRYTTVATGSRMLGMGLAVVVLWLGLFPQRSLDWTGRLELAGGNNPVPSWSKSP